MAIPPEAPAKSAAGHLLANQILLGFAVALHALSLLSVAINVALAATGASPAPATDSEAAAFYGTFACIGVWSAVGLVWAPLNLWGLHRRARWARTSTVAYWSVSLFTCCCLPFGAYGIYALLRRDVRAVFEPGA